jgi:hypothetical protein
MMPLPTKPTADITWGSAIAGGDIAEPPSGTQEAGWQKVGSPLVPQKPPYQWWNYWMNGVWEWIMGYLVPVTDYLLQKGNQDGGTDGGVDKSQAVKLTIAGYSGTPAEGDVLWWVPTYDCQGGAATVQINGGITYGLYNSGNNAYVDMMAWMNGIRVGMTYDGAGWRIFTDSPWNRPKRRLFASFNGNDATPIRSAGVSLVSGGNVGTVGASGTGGAGQGAFFETTGANNDLAWVSEAVNGAVDPVFIGELTKYKFGFGTQPIGTLTNECAFHGLIESGGVSGSPVLDGANVAALYPGNINGLGLWYNPAVSAHWLLTFCFGNSATAVQIDTGIAVDSNFHAAEIQISSGGIATYSSISVIIDGVLRASQSAFVAFDGPQMRPYHAVKAKTAAVKSMALWYIDVEQAGF